MVGDDTEDNGQSDTPTNASVCSDLQKITNSEKVEDEVCADKIYEATENVTIVHAVAIFKFPQQVTMAQDDLNSLGRHIRSRVSQKINNKKLYRLALPLIWFI